MSWNIIIKFETTSRIFESYLLRSLGGREYKKTDLNLVTSRFAQGYLFIALAPFPSLFTVDEK